MANKRIFELTSDTGVIMSDNNLYPVDKYVSPGVYTTVYKSGLNMKTYVSNYITGLSTASFTNINTSINNVKPSIYAEQKIYNVTTTTGTIPFNVGAVFKVYLGNPAFFTGRPMYCNVRLIAYSNAGTGVGTLEFNALFNSSTNAMVGTTIVFNYGQSITFNTGGVSTGVDGGGQYIQFSNVHTIGGETVTAKATATLYADS